MKNYETEARLRYGKTNAYGEYEEKTKNYTKENWSKVNEGLMAVFAEFAELNGRGVGEESEESKALAAKLQAYITANYYTCTNEILSGLGQTYVCDERFKKNIDKYGAGTAEFASAAISAYCKELSEK